MITDVRGGWAIPIHTKATTKKTPYAYRLDPPNALPRAIRANAGGTIPRLAREGHVCHGASQIAIPRASATAETAAVAITLSPGAGSGSVTRPSTPEPAKKMAASRPWSLRRRPGPSFTEEVPAWLVVGERLWAGSLARKSGGGCTVVASARRRWPSRVAIPPPAGCAVNSSLTIKARSHLSWDYLGVNVYLGLRSSQLVLQGQGMKSDMGPRRSAWGGGDCRWEIPTRLAWLTRMPLDSKRIRCKHSLRP